MSGCPNSANRRVLSSPTAALDDTVPLRRAVTLRHLLTNSSGYGMALVSSPLQQAMADNGTEAGPGFWDGMGWGFGVGVQTDGPHRGRYGWSGGQGTDFFVDPDGTVGILLTQVEMGERIWPVVGAFQALHQSSR
jgi:CubicO group peptidase (beta-lactamase class C family)